MDWYFGCKNYFLYFFRVYLNLISVHIQEKGTEIEYGEKSKLAFMYTKNEQETLDHVQECVMCAIISMDKLRKPRLKHGSPGF